MRKVYDAAQVRSLLTERIAQDGYAKVCEAFDCSQPYLSQVTTGNRPPGPKILAGLGLVRAYAEPAKESGKP